MTTDEILSENMNHDVPIEVSLRLRKRLAAFRERLETREAPHGFWPRRLSLPRWAIAVPPAAAALITVIVVVVSMSGRSQVALGQVLERVRSAQNLQFKTAVEVESLPRQEFETMVMEPGRVRQLLFNGMVNIADQRQRKALLLNPATKTAVLLALQGGEDNLTPTGFLESLRSYRGEAQEQLGKREIAGREAVGFRFKRDGNTWTIWADAETGNPVLIKVDMTVPCAAIVTMSDFVFDVKLDESLFSLTPPPGYTLQTAMIDASKPSEKDLIEGLRAVLAHNAGHFPDEFTLMGMASAMDDYGKTNFDPQTQNVLEWGMKMSRALAFVKTLKPENDWRYVGQDVKYGELDKPVCWWRSVETKSGPYRVIYSDLSIREVRAEDLPKVPEIKPVTVKINIGSLGQDEYIRPSTEKFVKNSYWIHKPVGTFQAKGGQLENLLRLAYAEKGKKVVIEGVVPPGRYDVLIKVPAEEKDRLMPRVRQCLEEAFGLRVSSQDAGAVIRFPE